MRAHTITVNARASSRTRRTILALSLAGVFLAVASTASATTMLSPTGVDVGNRRIETTSHRPPHLTLSLGDWAYVTTIAKTNAKWLTFLTTTNNDSNVVVRGDVKRDTKQLVDKPNGKITHAKLKHPDRLQGRSFKVKIKATATDEFGQTATDKVKYVIRRCPPSSAFEYGTPFACGYP